MNILKSLYNANKKVIDEILEILKNIFYFFIIFILAVSIVITLKIITLL